MEETPINASNSSTTSPSTQTMDISDPSTTSPSIQPKDISNPSTTTPPSIQPTTVRRTVTSPSVCKVCGGPAKYSYYGAIVCHSCKVFFKRNAPSPTVRLKLQCTGSGNCEINVNTRRVCSYCRLDKCFTIGLCTELIRSAHIKRSRKNRKQKTTTDSTSTALVRLNDTNQPEQLPTLNLLRADQSTLTVDEWNLISNLVHCFDEYSGLSFTQHFTDEQTALPPKLRFKFLSVRDFFTSMMTNVQSVFEKNREHASLSLHDRTLLLRSTIEYTATIGSALVLRQTHLFDNPLFSESAELIFRPSTVALIKRLINQLDPDTSFLKIIFGMMAFLISNNTVYLSTPSTVLTDTSTIIHVQDMYAELAWKYLLYKYNHHDAVLCFSNLVRCICLLSDSVVEAHEERQYTDIIDSVVELTEQKLNLNS